MRYLLVILNLILPLVFLSGCLLTKGHFTKDGSMWVWNKDQNGRYNAHNPLRLDEATKWVDTVLTIPSLRTLQIDITSKKDDYYYLNDSILFFNLKTKELPNYHSYYTFAHRLNVDPERLKRSILIFDELGLNRFYKEDEFIAFNTVTSLGYEKGYLYFIDSTVGSKINPGDTLDFRKEKEFKYFRQANVSRLLVLKKYNVHWIEWRRQVVGNSEIMAALQKRPFII
jgi:hypothetical protein